MQVPNPLLFSDTLVGVAAKNKKDDRVRSEEKWQGLTATVIATFCNSTKIPLSDSVEDWPSPEIGRTNKSKSAAKTPVAEFDNRPDLGTVPVIDTFAGTSSAGCSALLLGVDYIGCKKIFQYIFSFFSILTTFFTSGRM